jgi:hypothetical protein
VTFSNSVASNDVIGQWEGNDERRTVNNSRENIQDTKIPRISYSKEWLCIRCGVFISILFYNTISGHGTKIYSNQLSFFLSFPSNFLSYSWPLSTYPLLPLITLKYTHTHTHTHSAGHLWTRDQPDAETSTFQHTTLSTDIHAPSGIQTLKPSKRAASDPCLIQHDPLHSTYKPMFWKFINYKFSDVKENKLFYNTI